MLGDETELARAVDRAVSAMGNIEAKPGPQLSEAAIRQGLNRSARLRHVAFKTAIKKLVERRRNRVPQRATHQDNVVYAPC